MEQILHNQYQTFITANPPSNHKTQSNNFHLNQLRKIINNMHGMLQLYKPNILKEASSLLNLSINQFSNKSVNCSRSIENIHEEFYYIKTLVKEIQKIQKMNNVVQIFKQGYMNHKTIKERLMQRHKLNENKVRRILLAKQLYKNAIQEQLQYRKIINKSDNFNDRKKQLINKKIQKIRNFNRRVDQTYLKTKQKYQQFLDKTLKTRNNFFQKKKQTSSQKFHVKHPKIKSSKITNMSLNRLNNTTSQQNNVISQNKSSYKHNFYQSQSSLDIKKELKQQRNFQLVRTRKKQLQQQKMTTILNNAIQKSKRLNQVNEFKKKIYKIKKLGIQKVLPLKSKNQQSYNPDIIQLNIKKEIQLCNLRKNKFIAEKKLKIRQKDQKEKLQRNNHKKLINKLIQDGQEARYRQHMQNQMKQLYSKSIDKKEESIKRRQEELKSRQKLKRYIQMVRQMSNQDLQQCYKILNTN